MFSFSIDKILQKERQEFSFRRLLQQIFIDDWMMKSIALAITLALWFGVNGLRTPTVERLKDVTLKLRISNNLEITNDPVKEVDLVVRGDTRKIDQIPKDLVVSLELADVQPGDRTIELTPDTVNVELPTGVKLEEIQPSRISITLEPVEKREVPVKVATLNNLPEGFEMYREPAAVPNKVVVRGPASYVNSLNFISTDRIDLRDKKGDFTAQQVRLNTSNSKVTIVDKTSVDVFFKVGETRIDKLFFVPIANSEENEKVILYGPKALLNSLEADNFQVERLDSDSSLRLVLPEKLKSLVMVRNGDNFEEVMYR